MGGQLEAGGCHGLRLHAHKKLVVSHGTETHGNKKSGGKDSTMLQCSTEGKITARSENQRLAGLRAAVGRVELRGYLGWWKESV